MIESENLRWEVFRRVGQSGGPPLSTADLFKRLKFGSITRLDVNTAGNIFLRADIRDTTWDGVQRLVFLLRPA